MSIDASIQELAGDPAGGYVYAGSTDGIGVYRSHLSDGETWSPLTSIRDRVSSIGVAPSGIPLLVGIYAGGVARSDDHGMTFPAPWLNDAFITAVAADETGAYAAASRAGYRGVYVDRGDGGGFLPLGSFDVDTFVIWRLSLAPDGTPWIGTDRSGPFHWDGSEWQPTTDPVVAGGTVHSITFDPHDAGTVFLGMGDPAIRVLCRARPSLKDSAAVVTAA